MDAFGIAIVVSLLVYLVVGNLAGRKVKHLDDYFVAGRNAPTFLILGTLVASVIGTNSFMGDVSMAYSGYSTPLIWSVPICILGYIFGGLYFGRYLRRAETLTVAEFFGRRFASRRIRVLAGVLVMLGLGGYLTTVTMGAGLILPKITDLTYVQALVVVWVGYSAFTFYAGSQGVVITDTIMFMFFSIVGVICTIGLLILYVRPYQAATGQLTEGGPFVVWSGELVLALIFGGLVSGGGLIAHWAIKRFYASGI
jgi:sodium/pantothenate symporter